MWKNNITWFWLFSIAMISFAAICYRAACLEITHDEAFSFYLIKTNYLAAMATTANTHWLNSFWMKLVELFGFQHPFMLRLHSVLSFLPYAYFTYRGISFFKSVMAKGLFMVLMICNPLVLEFFSVARGYGISLAFFMGVSFYALQLLKHPDRQRSLRKALLFAVLSIIGNYTALYPILSIFSYLLLTHRKDHSFIFSLKRNRWWVGLFFSTVIGAIANMLLIKYVSNDLRYGADHSFVFETLASMFLFIAFQPFPSDSHLVGLLVNTLSFVAISGSPLILGWAAKQKNRDLAFGPFLFLLTFFFYFLSHVLFSSPYPLARTTLILFPMLVFTLVFWVDTLSEKSWFSVPTSYVIAGVMVFVTFSNFSLKYTLEWRTQADAQRIFEEIIGQRPRSKDKTSILGDEPCYAVWKNYYSQAEPAKYLFDYDVLDKTRLLDSAQFITLLKGKRYFIVSKTHMRNYYKNLSQLTLKSYYPVSETWVYSVHE